MIKKILHIGVAVKEIGASANIFSALFNTSVSQTEHVPEQNANIAFYSLGDSSVELLESTVNGSSISKFIEKKGEGIHHICLEVDDIKKEIARLKEKGFQFVNDVPRNGGDGYLVAFLHPHSTNGVLIELAEKTK